MAVTLLQMKAIFPDTVRQGIVDVMYRQGPQLFDRLHFIQHDSLAYPYSQNVRLPGIAFRGLGESFASTAEGVINPAVEHLAILGGDVDTDSVYIAQKGLGPARAWRLAQKVKAASRFFIKNFFVGDKSTTPKGFDGLKTRLTGTQLITNATNGDTPDHAKFVEAQDAVEGPNGAKLLCMNKTTRRLLSLDVAANAAGMGIYDVGKQLTQFNGSDIFEIENDETETAILPFTETCGSGTTCCSAYVVRLGDATDEEYVQGIAGFKDIISMIDVGYLGANYRDTVQMAAGIGLFSGYCAARIQGITAS